MKRLSEIISSIEHQLSTATGVDLINLYLLLAEHLELVSSQQQKVYLQLILESTLVSSSSPQKIKAEILMAGLVMNQLKAEDALVIANSALEKATQMNYSLLVIQAKMQKAIALQYNGNPDEALVLIDQCVEDSIALGIKEIIREAKTYASLIYTDKDLLVAGKHAMDALEIAKQIGQRWIIGYNYAILGFWAQGNKVDEDSFSHFKLAEEYLFTEGADEYYGNILMQLSIFEKDNERFENAFNYLKKASTIFEK